MTLAPSLTVLKKLTKEKKLETVNIPVEFLDEVTKVIMQELAYWQNQGVVAQTEYYKGKLSTLDLIRNYHS